MFANLLKGTKYPYLYSTIVASAEGEYFSGATPAGNLAVKQRVHPEQRNISCSYNVAPTGGCPSNRIKGA